MLRNKPQDLPWTRLNLGEPIGMFTGRKLAGLTDDYAQCRALLRSAGVRYTMLASVKEGEQCGYADAVRLGEGGARRIGFAPASLGISCPVAAALAMWEWNVLQPAAQRHFGAQVTRIEHLGSYSCRRIYGRSAGDWSEHATADAIDVAGFRLSNGERISVLKDWKEGGKKAAFLHEIRTGGCRLFSTVLSPDYNAAHRDHLHLDQAERGEMGWRACR
ncbi:MAG: extensin family protein [Sphingomonadales bacterium]|nr:MAG: extensin family protein [Sphingomonadales bacterium]